MGRENRVKIIEIKDRNDELLNTLVNVWEDSVKSTHTFLNEQEIEHIKEYVLMALKNVEHLLVVDNGEAVGFKTYKKTELDEEGNPYPLLYMKLDR